jgi:peptidoglycan biosynthesis protein MviN/MurJ (putative lipid II flippase)
MSFFSFPAMIPIAAAILLLRHSFLRRSRQTQIVLAILTVVGVVLQLGGIPMWSL